MVQNKAIACGTAATSWPQLGKRTPAGYSEADVLRHTEVSWLPAKILNF